MPASVRSLPVASSAARYRRWIPPRWVSRLRAAGPAVSNGVTGDQVPRVEALRWVLERHYQRLENESEGNQHRQIHFKADGELPPAAEGIESPYDPEARFPSRYQILWTGYQVPNIVR